MWTKKYISCKRKGTDMFIDKAKILIKSGSGGNGAIAFHREKYVAAVRTSGGNILFPVKCNCAVSAAARLK